MIKLNKLRFGSAGIPLSTEKRETIQGIRRNRELGLDSMELEFVRSVNIKKDKAPLVANAAKESDIVLTAHGSYYINLNSQDKSIIEASKKRILDAARILDLCNGYSVTFHPAYYLKQDSKKVYEKVKKQMKEVVKKAKDEGLNVWIRPETTGKPTQFGDVDELVKLSTEIEQVLPCIDFAHLHARSNGKYNTKPEIIEVMSKIEKGLGKEALKNMHIHMSGIHYGEKGERNHLILKESDFNYKDILRVWKEFKIKGSVVCESPNIEDDALLMQKFYNKL